jgi:hypothetical protein
LQAYLIDRWTEADQKIDRVILAGEFLGGEGGSVDADLIIAGHEVEIV